MIETDAGRAVSTDGTNWEIQLLAPRPGAWGSLEASGGMGHARYGVWSATEGFARYPRVPQLPDAAARVDRLRREIEAAVDALPFALNDDFECWLCVGARPVALLATAEAMPARRTPPPWRALPDDEAASALESAVRALPAGRQWFAPESDGMKVSLGGTALAAAAFPELPLDVAAFPEPLRPMVVAYLDRLAARLLTLPLGAATRARLERAAAADAIGVARFHRLYPAMCDAALITALRVEARLRSAA